MAKREPNGWRVINYKTKEDAGVQFRTRQLAREWIWRRRAETALSLYWVAKKAKKEPT